MRSPLHCKAFECLEKRDINSISCYAFLLLLAVTPLPSWQAGGKRVEDVVRVVRVRAVCGYHEAGGGGQKAVSPGLVCLAYFPCEGISSLLRSGSLPSLGEEGQSLPPLPTSGPLSPLSSAQLPHCSRSLRIN